MTVQVVGVRRALALVLWVGSLAIGIAAFHALGAGSLEAPPLHPEGWSGWASGRDPLVATVAVLRLLVLGLGWYLLAVTLLGVLARGLRAARLVTLADAVTVPALRGFLRHSLGVSLATAMIAAGPTAAGQGARAYAAPPDTPGAITDVLPVGGTHATDPIESSDDGPVTDLDLPEAFLPLPLELVHAGEDGPDGAGGDAARPAAGPSDPVERRDAPVTEAAEPGVSDGSGEDGARAPATADDAGAAGGGTGASDATDDPAPVPEDPVAPGAALHDAGAAARDGVGDAVRGTARDGVADLDAAASADSDDEAPSGATHGTSDDHAGDTITVQAGDSLWSIAEHVLASAGRPHDEPAVVAYWVRVIDHNRDALADPDNPDLIFPGDTIVLPELSAPTGASEVAP